MVLVFETESRLPAWPLAMLAVAVTGLTVVGGLASSLDQLPIGIWIRGPSGRRAVAGC